MEQRHPFVFPPSGRYSDSPASQTFEQAFSLYQFSFSSQIDGSLKYLVAGTCGVPMLMQEEEAASSDAAPDISAFASVSPAGRHISGSIVL